MQSDKHLNINNLISTKTIEGLENQENNEKINAKINTQKGRNYFYLVIVVRNRKEFSKLN